MANETKTTKQTVVEALALLPGWGSTATIELLQATFRNRVAAVNRALKLAGRSEKLVRGNGYYYFVDGEAFNWYSSSVSTCYADSLSLERWLDEFDVLKNSWRNL